MLRLRTRVTPFLVVPLAMMLSSCAGSESARQASETIERSVKEIEEAESGSPFGKLTEAEKQSPFSESVDPGAPTSHDLLHADLSGTTFSGALGGQLRFKSADAVDVTLEDGQVRPDCRYTVTTVGHETTVSVTEGATEATYTVLRKEGNVTLVLSGGAEGFPRVARGSL